MCGPIVRKLVKRDERVVFFFGKRRKLNDSDEFKVGRMIVHVFPELLGQRDGRWYAELIAYNDDVVISGALARSRASAVKKLERRIDSLHLAFNNLYENYV